MTTKLTLKLAHKILNRTRKFYAKYEADVDQWYRTNPGYRFPECPHGVSLWTDYDPMCGYCEDGRRYFDFETEALDALGQAKRKMAEVERRQQVVINISKETLPDGTVNLDKLYDWAAKPLEV